MKALLSNLVLERTGPAEATVGMISLPLPRELANSVAIDHSRAAMHPLAWWVRHEVPRRALAIVVDDKGVPERLRVVESSGAREDPHPNPLPKKGEGERWNVSTRIVKEKLDFKPLKFFDVASLRGVPVEDCTTVEFELLLNYGGKQLAMQFGATGPSGEGDPYYWQNVQVDPLWSNDAAQAVRVGGVIYNGDTYLWADVYFLLFANGVAHTAAHFVNTKLHIEGYDFQGLPWVRFALKPSPSGRGQGEGTSELLGGTKAQPASRVDAARPHTHQTYASPHPNPLPEGEGARPFPACGTRLDFPGLQLNLADAAQLASDEFPGKLVTRGGEILWQPFARTFNPQLPGAPANEWPVGFSRTVRFQFSLSDAAPVVARYRAPSWWYAVSGEPWAGGYLPVDGQFAAVSTAAGDIYRPKMKRGRFDAGSAELGNDGFLGTGLLHSYYHTGRPELFTDGLDYCYYWADIAVDHSDFTVHQWIGGWPWKTCAYSKFRDVFFGYLETGDPNLLDTVENAADAYWAWFRANWPRCTIGRDAFEIGGWSLLRRYLRTERARERTREFARMLGRVLETRGSIGGQLGAGPHPGYISSLYMTGVTMTSLLHVAEAEVEEGHLDRLGQIAKWFGVLSDRWMRDDVEMFPSNYGKGGRSSPWGQGGDTQWAMITARVYPLMARLRGEAAGLANQALHKAHERPLPSAEEIAKGGRPGDNFIDPLYHDALLLGARVSATGEGLEITPLGDPELWPAEQTVATPWGPMKVITLREGNEVKMQFEAEQEFAVAVHQGEAVANATSRGTCSLTRAAKLRNAINEMNEKYGGMLKRLAE